MLSRAREYQILPTAARLTLFGATAEAMPLYQSCLRGELKVTLLRDTPMEDQAPDAH